MLTTLASGAITSSLPLVRSKYDQSHFTVLGIDGSGLGRHSWSSKTHRKAGPGLDKGRHVCYN